MMRELHAEVGTATPERFDVILPAGGRISGEFAEKAGTTVKTLITFEGQTILHRTLVALRKTGRAGRIVVIGPPEVLAEAQRMGVEGLLPEGDSGPENILRGLRWLSEARELERVALEMASTVIQEEGGGFRVLIVTTDLPFLTAGALERFLDACPPDAELAVPVVTQEAFDARYPNSGSTYTPLKDGSFTIGGAFVADGATVLRNEAHLHAVFAARKSPL